MPHNYNQAGDLVRLLRERAASRPDTPAYTFLPDSEGGASTWTHAQLDAQARTIRELQKEVWLAVVTAAFDDF